MTAFLIDTKLSGELSLNCVAFSGIGFSSFWEILQTCLPKEVLVIKTTSHAY